MPAFIDGLTNWYIRRSRRRFWAEGLNDDKRSAYETLHYVLRHMAHVLAPIMPFFAERLASWTGMTDSVHLGFWPMPQPKRIDADRQKRVNTTREIVGLAAGIRARQGIKLRQPLAKLSFALAEAIDVDLDVIKAEANVLTVEVLKNTDGIAQQIIKVDARAVGKIYGKKTQELIKAGKAGEFTLHPNGTVTVADETLTADQYSLGYLTEEGVQAEGSRIGVVLLATEISPELLRAGYARDIIRMIQDMRKESGFAVADRITVTHSTTDEVLAQTLIEHADMIMKEVLAVGFTAGTTENMKEMDGRSIGFKLAK